MRPSNQPRGPGGGLGATCRRARLACGSTFRIRRADRRGRARRSPRVPGHRRSFSGGRNRGGRVWGSQHVRRSPRSHPGRGRALGVGDPAPRGAAPRAVLARRLRRPAGAGGRGLGAALGPEPHRREAARLLVPAGPLRPVQLGQVSTTSLAAARRAPSLSRAHAPPPWRARAGGGISSIPSPWSTSPGHRSAPRARVGAFRGLVGEVRVHRCRCSPGTRRFPR